MQRVGGKKVLSAGCLAKVRPDNEELLDLTFGWRIILAMRFLFVLVFFLALFSSACSPTNRPEEVDLTQADVIGSYKLNSMECDNLRYEFSGLSDVIAISGSAVNIQTSANNCTQVKAGYSYNLGSGSLSISGANSTCSTADCKISYGLIVGGNTVPHEENCEAKAQPDKKLFYVDNEIWIKSQDCMLFYGKTSSADPGANPF